MFKKNIPKHMLRYTAIYFLFKKQLFVKSSIFSNIDLFILWLIGLYQDFSFDS